MTAASLGAVDRLIAEINDAADAAQLRRGRVSWRQAREWAARLSELAALTPAAGGDDELLDAAEAMLRWLVKNVDLWHFPQYDDLHRACTNRRAAPAPPPADAVRALVAKLEQPRTLSMFMGAHDMALALVQERAEIARELAALSAAPAGEETEQSIKADAYDMIAEALERAGLAGSSIVESVARLIAAAPTPEGREPMWPTDPWEALRRIEGMGGPASYVARECLRATQQEGSR